MGRLGELLGHPVGVLSCSWELLGRLGTVLPATLAPTHRKIVESQGMADCVFITGRVSITVHRGLMPLATVLERS